MHLSICSFLLLVLLPKTSSLRNSSTEGLFVFKHADAPLLPCYVQITLWSFFLSICDEHVLGCLRLCSGLTRTSTMTERGFSSSAFPPYSTPSSTSPHCQNTPTILSMACTSSLHGVQWPSHAFLMTSSIISPFSYEASDPCMLNGPNTVNFTWLRSMNTWWWPWRNPQEPGREGTS